MYWVIGVLLDCFHTKQILPKVVNENVIKCWRVFFLYLIVFCYLIDHTVFQQAGSEMSFNMNEYHEDMWFKCFFYFFNMSTSFSPPCK